MNMVFFQTASKLATNKATNNTLSGQLKPFSGKNIRAAVSPQGRRPLWARAVLEVSEASFESEVLQAKVPVLIDFWATWCGPCKLVAPSMEWAQKEYGNNLKVVKVEADGNKSLIEGHKVYGLPCLIVYKDGNEVPGSHREGAITKKDLVKYIEQYTGLSVAA